MKTVQIEVNEEEIKYLTSFFNLRRKREDDMIEACKELERHKKKIAKLPFWQAVFSGTDPYEKFRRAKNLYEINETITMPSLNSTIEKIIRNIEKQI